MRLYTTVSLLVPQLNTLIMHREYGKHSIAHVTNSNKDIGSANNSNNNTIYMQLEQATTTNNTTSQNGEHVISMDYAVNNTIRQRHMVNMI